MSEPLVACIMLTRDRPAMARRAVECFRAQTYERKRLLVFDTGHQMCDVLCFRGISFAGMEWHQRETVGSLRNSAVAETEADIICHFDDDDISHPNRIAEQVAYLQGSGAECVGYFDGLFWDSRNQSYRNVDGDEEDFSPTNEAHIFRHSHMRYVLGASMCYWRSAWERRPFPDVNIAEDTGWMFDAQGGLAINTWGCSSFAHGDPRIIHEIHGGNTNPYDDMGNKFWSRTPEWDDYCRRTLNCDTTKLPIPAAAECRGDGRENSK